MKHLMRSIRKYLSLTIVLLICMSLTVTAFAAEDRIVSDEEIAFILDEINAEYGTNFHALSTEELIQLGLPTTDSEPMTVGELEELENTLRYVAETQIPQFEKATQEAVNVIDIIASNPVTASAGNSNSALSISSETITATKAIDYATAGAVAYTSQNILGNTIWGEIQYGFCTTDTQQSTWFRATSPTVTRTNSNRTLYWVGTGNYYSNINGTQYYLYSGTQYASMDIDDYI